MTIKKDFYVYFHKIKNTGEVFYVGKGRNYRIQSKEGRNKLWKEITSTNEWIFEKYRENLNEEDALNIELSMINLLQPVANIHKKDIRKKKLDLNFINQRYEYSEDSPTGLIYKVWNGQYGSKRKEKGDIAGVKNKCGYYVVTVKNSGNILVHRVVWGLLKNEDPGNCVIDHLDGNRENNIITNLRKIMPDENSRNSTLRKNNKTGVAGVFKTGNFYTATWVNSGISNTKNVSISKFGEELALELACYMRLCNIDRNSFSERHIGNFNFNLLKNKSNKEIEDMLNDNTIASNTTGIQNIYYNKIGFWEFKVKNYSKRFSIKKYGDSLARALAIEFRDRYLGCTFKAVDGFSLHETTQMIMSDTKLGNNSNIKYINFKLNSKGQTILIVQKSIKRKNWVKRFNCNKLGIINAHAMAINWITKEVMKCPSP